MLILDLYGNAMEQEFRKSILVTIIEWAYNIFKDTSILKHGYFQKPKVQTKSQSIEKNIRKERESK